MAGMLDATDGAAGARSDTSTPQAAPPSRARGKERLDDTTNTPRRWTRSHSPLRQLLNSATSSRPSSPKGNHQVGGRGGRGGGYPLVDPDQFGEHEKSATTNRYGSGDVVGELPESESTSNVVRETGNEGVKPVLQQQMEQKRVRSFLHPVSYDECHILSEDEQTSGCGDGSDSCNDSNTAVGGAISGDGI